MARVSRRDRREQARRLRKQLESDLRVQLGGASPRRYRTELTAMATLLVFGGVATDAGAAVTSAIAGDQLTITITGDVDDDAALSCVGGNVKINGADPGTGAALCDSFDELAATGDASTNTIDLAVDDPSDFEVGEVTILAGAGSDSISNNVGSGGEVTNGPGDDTLDAPGSFMDLVETADTSMTLTDTSFVGGAALGTDSLVIDDFLTSVSGARLTGGAGGNTIDVSAFTGFLNTLDGAGGADSLVGSSDAFDTFTGGLGNDTVVGEMSDEIVETRDDHMTWSDDKLEIGAPVTETDTYPDPIGGATLTGGAGGNLISSEAISSQGSFAGHSIVLAGAGGSDTLRGGGRHDLTGGPGDDTLISAAGPGDPTSRVVESEDVNFTLTTTSGQDGTLTSAATGTDSLDGVIAADLTGGASDNSIDASGYDFFTTLSGGAGGDTLRGGSDADLFPAELGSNDSIAGGSGDDTIGLEAINLGGPNYGSFTLTDTSMTGALAGNDSISSIDFVGASGGNSGNIVDASAFSGAIEYRSGDGDDSIKGGDGFRPTGFIDDIIWAGTGEDTIDGYDGSDRIEVNGPHSMVSDFSSNTVSGGDGFDTLVGGQGVDSFNGDGSGGQPSDQNTVENNAEGTVTVTNTAITSSVDGVDSMANIDVVEIQGGDGDDLLDASDFDPTNGLFNSFFGTTLLGNGGDDTLRGSHGQDSLDGGFSDTDRLVVEDAPHPNLVFSENLGTLRLDGDDFFQGGSTDTVTDIDEASLTGNADANALTAGVVDFPVTMLGAAGNDTLTGGSAADSLNGEGGVDDYFANNGDDLLFTMDSTAEGVINCGAGTETVTADAADTLNADCGGGDPTVPGGGGNPTLPGGGGGGGGGGAAADLTAPVIQSARAKPKKFTVDKRGKAEPQAAAKKKKKKKKGGTTISYALSEASRVVFTFELEQKGRKVKGKCRKQTKKRKKGRRCKLYKRTGSFAQLSLQGANTKKFSGKIGRRKLKPGTYRTTLVATDASGNASAPRTLKLKVVKPKKKKKR